MKSLVYSLLFCGVISCALADTVSEREAVAKQIKALTADLSCDTNSQCLSVGFGSRACGGFDDYVIYSTKVVKTEQMKALSKKYFDLDKQYNIEKGRGSICVVEPVKKARCVQSKCVEWPPKSVDK